MQISSKGTATRTDNTGAQGVRNQKPDLHQAQAADQEKNLSFQHKHKPTSTSTSTAKGVLPLQPSTPPSNAGQQVAAHEPWGWKAIVMPHMGAKAHQRYVHFSQGNISVSEQQGAGLFDQATHERFCQSVVTEIMRGHPDSGIPPQARLDLHHAAITYSHVLAGHILNRGGPHVTVQSFMAVAKELMKVSGQSIDVLQRRCDELNDANPQGQMAAYRGTKEAWGCLR